jgi:hypothetical protein
MKESLLSDHNNPPPAPTNAGFGKKIKKKIKKMIKIVA